MADTAWDSMGRIADTQRAARILVIDIETGPNLAWVWGVWDQNVSLTQLEQPSHVMCFAAKWVGKRQVMFHSEHHDGREAMVAAAWRLLDEDDTLMCAILTANGDTFCAGMDLKAGAEGEHHRVLAESREEVPRAEAEAREKREHGGEPLLAHAEGLHQRGEVDAWRRFAMDVATGTRVVLAAGHADGTVVEQQHGHIALVVDNIEQALHTHMQESRIADHGDDLLVLVALASPFVEA